MAQYTNSVSYINIYGQVVTQTFTYTITDEEDVLVEVARKEEIS